MNQFASGLTLEQILFSHKERLDQIRDERKRIAGIVKRNTVIFDGLAICDLSESGIRSNGYLITALAGDEALACCVIHGYLDGSIEDPDRPALGASFYANSFRAEQNRFDLSKLATLLDPTGGGHANACGCRIQSQNNSNRKLTEIDKQYNLQKWLDLWSERETKMVKI